MYYSLFGQMKKSLVQLDTWLEAAEQFAQSRSFDSSAYLSSRLAPDQFPFSRQVQLACDTAKLAAFRLTEKPAPEQADGDATLQDLRARARAVVAYLETLQAADFDGAADRAVTQPRWQGKVMSGGDYFLEHALPNFFFHLTHAYALLRHNGVTIGKRDYLGPLTYRNS
jgi:hypothetical protein